MASAYPGGLDTFATNKADATTTPTDHPDHHNDLADAVNKIEAELGVDPAGAAATVVARLDTIETPVALKAGRITSSQTINQTTATTIIYNSAVEDIGSLTLNTSTGVITVGEDGWYTVNAYVRATGGGFDARRIYAILQKDGSVELGRADQDGTGSVAYLNVTAVVTLEIGDTLQVVFWHDSSVGAASIGTGGQNRFECRQGRLIYSPHRLGYAWRRRQAHT